MKREEKVTLTLDRYEHSIMIQALHELRNDMLANHQITDDAVSYTHLDVYKRQLESDEIRRLYNKQWYPEALYLLAMVDYLSRENGVPLCTKYSDIRNCKLKRCV